MTLGTLKSLRTLKSLMTLMTLRTLKTLLHLPAENIILGGVVLLLPIRKFFITLKIECINCEIYGFW